MGGGRRVRNSRCRPHGAGLTPVFPAPQAGGRGSPRSRDDGSQREKENARTQGPLHAAPSSLGARVGVRSHAPGRPTPALPDRARFDRSSYALAFLTGQDECQTECVCALRGAPQGSDRGKGKGKLGVGGGWKDPGPQRAEPADGQTTKALSLLLEREIASEKKKQDGG